MRLFFCLVPLLLLGFSACGPREDNAFTIGLSAPLTGEQAAFGEKCVNGAKLAAEEINAQGGVRNRPLELTVVDDRGDVMEGVNAFYRLTAYGADIMIAGVTSSVAVGLSAPARDTKTVLICPSATADIVDTQNDTVFRTCFTDRFQGAAAAQWAKAQGITRACVLYAAGDAYSVGLKDAFCRECARIGISICLVTAASCVGEADYRAQLLRVSAQDVPLLYAPLYYGTAGPYLLPQAREAGFSGIILGGDAYDGLEQYINKPALLDRVFYTNHYADTDENEKASRFVAHYQKAYQDKSPGSFAALGYDAVYMAAQAANESQDLRTALCEIHFDGVTGSFTLDETGTPHKEAAVIGYQNGKKIRVGTVNCDGTIR